MPFLHLDSVCSFNGRDGRPQQWYATASSSHYATTSYGYSPTSAILRSCLFVLAFRFLHLYSWCYDYAWSTRLVNWLQGPD